MSNRLQHLHKKKQEHHEHQQPLQETHLPTSVQQGGNQQGRHQTVPRPYFASTDVVKPFDRNSYKKGEPSYPPPQSLYTSKDTELDPKVIRTSCTALPVTPQKTSFPISLWITPFATEQVCTVDLSAPLRCNRCKAYVNAYFQYDGTRRSATCNLCGVRFGIDQAVDKINLTAAEVSTQSILDFRVSDKFYMKKRIDIIKVVVLVELTMPMLEQGIFAMVIDSLKSVFESHQF